MGYKKDKPHSEYSPALDKLYNHYSKESQYDAMINGSVSKVYAFSNENIKDMLQDFDLKDKRILTVGSSGDQLFEAVLRGAKEVTVIDANILAQPYIELKIASIENLNMNEFMEYFTAENIFNHKFYRKVSHSLSPKSREFWDSVIMEAGNHHVNETLANNLAHGHFSLRGANSNSYLTNFTYYKKLQEKLNDCDISFINADFLDFSTEIKGKYDYILLSNIYDYMDCEEFFDGVLDLGENNLAENGYMQLYYSFVVDRDRYFVDCFRSDLCLSYGINNASFLIEKEVADICADDPSDKAMSVFISKDSIDKILNYVSTGDKIEGM